MVCLYVRPSPPPRRPGPGLNEGKEVCSCRSGRQFTQGHLRKPSSDRLLLGRLPAASPAACMQMPCLQAQRIESLSPPLLFAIHYVFCSPSNTIPLGGCNCWLFTLPGDRHCTGPIEIEIGLFYHGSEVWNLELDPIGLLLSLLCCLLAQKNLNGKRDRTDLPHRNAMSIVAAGRWLVCWGLSTVHRSAFLSTSSERGWRGCVLNGQIPFHFACLGCTLVGHSVF